mgnify:CR=1 FL=1
MLARPLNVGFCRLRKRYSGPNAGIRIIILNLVCRLPYCSIVLMLRVLETLPMVEGLNVNVPEFRLLPWLPERTPPLMTKFPKSRVKAYGPVLTPGGPLPKPDPLEPLLY